MLSAEDYYRKKVPEHSEYFLFYKVRHVNLKDCLN